MLGWSFSFIFTNEEGLLFSLILICMIRLNEMRILNLILSIFSVQTWGIAPKKSSEASNSSAIYFQSQLCHESILTFAVKSLGFTI